jgi:hypothetical protein
MNRSKEQRNAEVMKTMSILDDIPGIKVNHLFRARLLQRIDAAGESRSFDGGFNPRLAFFGLLLGVNIAMGTLLFMHEEPQTAARPVATAESFSDDYVSPALSYYDQQATESQGSESGK